MLMFFYVDIPLYEARILFSFGQTDADLSASLKRHRIVVGDTEYGNWQAYTERFSVNVCMVRLDSIPRTASQIGTLSHEIFHAATLILRERGMRLTPSSEESWAYLIGHITEKVFVKIAKHDTFAASPTKTV